jgi:hypothetical protein
MAGAFVRHADGEKVSQVVVAEFPFTLGFLKTQKAKSINHKSYITA